MTPKKLNKITVIGRFDCLTSSGNLCGGDVTLMVMSAENPVVGQPLRLPRRTVETHKLINPYQFQVTEVVNVQNDDQVSVGGVTSVVYCRVSLNPGFWGEFSPKHIYTCWVQLIPLLDKETHIASMEGKPWTSVLTLDPDTKGFGYPISKKRNGATKR